MVYPELLKELSTAYSLSLKMFWALWPVVFQGLKHWLYIHELAIWCCTVLPPTCGISVVISLIPH